MHARHQQLRHRPALLGILAVAHLAAARRGAGRDGSRPSSSAVHGRARLGARVAHRRRRPARAQLRVRGTRGALCSSRRTQPVAPLGHVFRRAHARCHRWPACRTEQRPRGRRGTAQRRHGWQRNGRGVGALGAHRDGAAQKERGGGAGRGGRAERHCTRVRRQRGRRGRARAAPARRAVQGAWPRSLVSCRCSRMAATGASSRPAPDARHCFCCPCPGPAGAERRPVRAQNGAVPADAPGRQRTDDARGHAVGRHAPAGPGRLGDGALGGAPGARRLGAGPHGSAHWLAAGADHGGTARQHLAPSPVDAAVRPLCPRGRAALDGRHAH